MSFDRSKIGFEFNICDIKEKQIVSVIIKLFDKNDKPRVNFLEFDLYPPIPCPGFEKPLTLWGINM